MHKWLHQRSAFLLSTFPIAGILTKQYKNQREYLPLKEKGKGQKRRGRW